MGPFFLACVAIVTQVESAPAAEAAPDLAATVKKLVRDLDAPEKSKRDQAEQQLMQLGTGALELLPENNERTPAERALRLDRIRSQLQRAQAESSLQGSTVTLSGDAMPLADVLTQVEKQTGNKLIDFREQFGQDANDVKLKLNFDKTPFWEAMDQVLDQANLTVYNYAGEEGVALVNRSDSQLPRHGRANYVGSFRIEGTEFTAHRDLRDPASHSLQLVIEVAWEPRLMPIVIMQPPDGVQATDESGQAVPISGVENELEIPVNPGSNSLDLPMQFTLPERKVKHFASLKGKLSALMPGRTETFRFDGLEKAKKVQRRKAGVTVVLDEVRKNNAIWEVRIRILFDKASGALESHRDWIANNPAYVENKKKETIPYASLETTRQTENEVGMAYLFDLPEGLKGWTFVYKTPAAIVSVPVEYELKDLELP